LALTTMRIAMLRQAPYHTLTALRSRMESLRADVDNYRNFVSQIFRVAGWFIGVWFLGGFLLIPVFLLGEQIEESSEFFKKIDMALLELIFAGILGFAIGWWRVADMKGRTKAILGHIAIELKCIDRWIAKDLQREDETL
jgi:hypothetical protein